MKKSIKAIVSNKDFLVGFLADVSYDNYWASFGTHQDTPKEVYENAKAVNECREEVWADVLLNGGFLLVEDREEEKDHKVSLKDIEKGFKKFIFACPRNYANIMCEDSDFYDVDNLLQTIIFGEVVYGLPPPIH